MLIVGICDDNTEHRKIARKIIEKTLFDKVEVQIVEYSTGQQIINSVSSGIYAPDLLILDINMPDINGLAVADFIKKYNIHTDVVFLTETAKYVFEGYKYAVFDYVLKTASMEEFQKSLIRYLSEKVNSGTEYLSVKSNGCIQHIKLNKIDYFESRGRKIAAVSEEEKCEFYLKMDELLNILPTNRFIRCHQSYIVNIKSIQSFTSTSLMIKRNFNIPVSRKYYQDLKVVLDNMSILP